MIVATFAAFGVWQLVWFADQSDRLVAILPTPWRYEWWLVMWTVVTATSTIAAVTARDVIVRMALGAVLVVEAAGVLTAISSDLPAGRQFWAIGQAFVIVILCAVLLSSPLREGLSLDGIAGSGE